MKLIEKAQKIILKHEDSVVYDRVFYNVKEIDDSHVEMQAFIDGGPQVAQESCASEEEVISFIQKTNI